MSFFRNAASVVLTQAVGLPIGLLTSVVLARFLSVDDRGLYSVATTFAMLAATLGVLGWPAASIYRIVRTRSDPAQVAGSGLALMTLLSGVVVLLSLGFESAIRERFLEGAEPWVFHLALALVPLHLYGQVLSAIARAIDRFDLQNWYVFSLNAGTLAGVGAALVLFEGGLTSALLALLGTNALFLLVLAVRVLRQTGVSLRLRGSGVARSLRYGLAAHTMSLGNLLHKRVDIFMLAWFLSDASQVAYYAVAAGLVDRLLIVPEAIGRALFPHLSRQSPEEAQRFTCFISRQSAAIVLAAILVLAPAASPLLPLLFGAPYAASVPPFLVLLPGVAMLTVYSVLTRYFAAVNQLRVNIVSLLAATVCNVALNVWLIPRHGILGAAIASLISYALQGAWVAAVFLSNARTGPLALFLLRRGDLVAFRRRAGPVLRRLPAAWRRAAKDSAGSPRG
jgi:O-antigen/teichoic acid export membrane protein